MDAVGDQRRGERIARQPLIALAVESEADDPRPVDATAQPCAHRARHVLSRPRLDLLPLPSRRGGGNPVFAPTRARKQMRPLRIGPR